MISQSRYIRIISGVGAGAAVAERKLMLRILTANNLIPAGVVMEFTSPDAVMSFFGAASEEYKRAVRYFGFISKQINSPDTLSFGRWVNTSIPSSIVGDAETKALLTFRAFTAGSLKLDFDGTPLNVTGIDLSTATSLTDVASKVQAAIIAAATAATIPALTNATVTYNTNTNQFVLTAGASSIGSGRLTTVANDDATDISAELGWGTTGTTFVAGQAADSPDQAISRSGKVSNNFGSFLFAGADLTLDQITSVAQWNDAQNNMYMYLFSTPFTNLKAVWDAIKGYSGTGVGIRSTALANDYVDQCPAEILAATNYNRPNATQNFMYYQFPDRNITISEDSDADFADMYRGNYIGVTQQAGGQLAFYQRGVLMGGSNDAVDMNVYANEMWMKSSITTRLFELFLNVGRVPANESGESTILGMIQTVIDNATVNGVISVGKPLTEIQKQYINQQSNDDTAWRQVQSIGYWITVGFETEVTSDNRIEYFATYTLIYSKDDAIRRVDGRDVMI